MKGFFRKWFAIASALLMICCAAVLTGGGTNASANTALPALQVRLTDDTVMRGEFLEIQVLNHQEYAPFAYVGGEYRISAYVSSSYYWGGDSYGCNPWGTIRIPTQNLNPETYLSDEDQGQFTVTVEAFDGDGWNVSETLRFTVTEPASGELYFRISTDEAVTRESYVLSAYAPGATRIEVYDTYDDLKFQSWGEELYETDGYNFRDTFSYWAKACYLDDQNEEFFLYSDTLTVNVTAESDVPVIDVVSDPVLTAGSDLVFQVPATEGYADWNLRVLRRRDGAPVLYQSRDGYEPEYGPTVPGQAYEIRIPTARTWTEYDDQGNPVGEQTEYYLMPGEAYNVELGFFQYNRHGFSYDVPLLVVGEDTVSDRIEMTVNGQTGTFHAAAHQDMSFHAQGPAQATGMLVFEGHDWRFYEGNEVYAEWGWWTRNHIPEFLFFAKITTDPIPDTEYDWHDLTFSETVSNVVRVINDTQGYLPVPEFALNMDENGEIVRGEWLEVSVSNLSDYDEYENIGFYATAYDSLTGEDFGGRFYGDGTEPIRIPTAGMDPSRLTEPLTVDVTATAGTGWYESTGNAQFTVAEPSGQTPAFSVRPEEVWTGEDYTISLYAPGAAEFRILESGNERERGNGSALTRSWSDNRSGRKVYEAQVRYENSSNWVSAGTAEVTVTAPNGPLQALTLDAPVFLEAGEDLVLSWDGCDDAEHVSLTVWREDDGEWVWNAWGTQKQFTVSAFQPEHAFHMEQLQEPGAAVLEAGESYGFQLVVSKRGYESEELQGSVYILSGDEEQVQGTLTLKLNGSSEFIQEFAAQQSVTVTVEAPGATGIRVLDPNRLGGRTEPEEDDWEYFDRYQVNDYLELSRRFDTQARRIQAQARYDDYDDVREPHGGANPWTAVSNDILLGIRSNSGRVPAPEVTVSAASVARGEWITFTVAPKSLGEWNWADIGRVNDYEIEWLDHYDFSDAGVLSVNTMPYEAGSYCAQIANRAPGFALSGETQLFFEITGSGTVTGGLEISPAEALPGEDLFISAWAPEVNRMRLEITREDRPDWFDWREWDGGPEAVHENWSAGESGIYHFELKDADSGERIGFVRTVTVGEGEGTLTRPDLSGLPGFIASGQAFNGSFTVDSRTEWVDIHIDHIPDDGSPWMSIYGSGRTKWDAGWTTLSLPASALSRSGVYQINVHTRATGYQSSDSRAIFLVAASGSGDIALTVNGSNADIAAWPSSTNLRVLAQAQGATAFRVLWGDRWDCRDARNGRAEWEIGFGDGDYTFVAQMTTDTPVWREENFDWNSFDWNDLTWTGLSNTVRVHVTSDGPLAKPEVTITPAGGTVSHGEILTVTAEPQEHAQWMWAELAVLRYGENGDRWFDNVRDGYFHSDDGNWTIRIPTGWFDPGDYWLKVGVDAEGWEGQEICVPVTIEASSGSEEVSLFLERETMRTNEGLSIYARAPGAERMELDITWDRDAGWRDHRETDHDQERWDWGCSCGGVYTFTLKARMPGENDPRTVVETLTVLSDGVLEKPVLTGVPGVLELGSGITGSFRAIPGAEWYNTGVRYSENGWDWNDLVNEDRRPEESGATDLIFDGDVFDRCGTYQLWVSANAIGMDNGYTETRIEVIDPQTLDSRLVLKVNDQTDGAQAGEILLHQNLPVTVDAPEGVTAVRVRSSTRNEWDFRAVMSENDLTWDWGFHEEGSDTLIAQAAMDPTVTAWCEEHDGMWDFDWSQVQWTMTSNAVTVQVTKYGDLANPQIDFVNGTDVVRGEWLAFDLHPVEHAWSYGVQVRRADGDWNCLIDMDYPLTETTRISVPTDGLEPGEYILQVDARCYGWHGDSAGYAFTVTEPVIPVDGPRFQVSSTEIMTRETLAFSVWAPGAEEVILCQEELREENIWWQAWGEILADHVTLNWAKTYHLLAFARYPGEEEWVQIGATLDIHVTAPYGEVGMILEAPETVRPDEELTVTLLCDYRGTDGSAECWVYDYTGDRDLELEYVSEEIEGGQHRITFRLQEGMLNPGTCLIYAYAFPGEAGYQLAYEERMLYVSEETVLGTLTVNKNPIEIFEDLTITVHADGATAVALWTSVNDIGWRYEVGDTLTEVQTMWWDMDHFMYGLYTTEPVNPEAEGFSWEDVHWTGATNSLDLTINPPSAELEPLDYTLSSTSVHRGEEIVITILNRNEGLENVSYGAHLTPAEGDDPEYGWFGPDDSNIIRVNTAEAEPGVYDLLITANAVSCHGLNESVRITVMNPAPDAATHVMALPAGLTEIGEEAFAGVAAEKITVPAGVTEIASRAFADCPNLITLDLPQGLNIAPDALEGCAHPVLLYGPSGSYLEAYADAVENLWFVPVD